MLNILILCGSLRKGSYNLTIAKALPSLSPAGMNFTLTPSISAIPHYDGDIQTESGFPQSVLAFVDAIRMADGLIIVSPEYNWSVPGVLKNAIDWASRVPEQPFKDKPIALQSSSTGLLGGSRMQYHLRQILVSVEAVVFVKPEIIVTHVHTKINDKGELADEPTRDAIRQQLVDFRTFMTRIIA